MNFYCLNTFSADSTVCALNTFAETENVADYYEAARALIKFANTRAYSENT